MKDTYKSIKIRQIIIIIGEKGKRFGPALHQRENSNDQ